MRPVPDRPTPADLAAAPVADVLRAWGRLGYPRRALRLREAAVAIVATHDGEVPADLLGRLLEQVGRLQRQVLAPRGLTFTGLTPRETDVLRLVADGLDTSEIASRMCYSERTVKNVLHDLTTRLQLKNRTHAVAYAVRRAARVREVPATRALETHVK